MGEYRKLWWTLFLTLGITFGILGWAGVEVYRQAPPIPQQVVAADGTVLMTQDDILNGQTAWQSTGGMQLGSVWGHGAYQAPDWTADWLHRELLAWLDLAARETGGAPYDALTPSRQAELRQALKEEYRTNTLDAATGVVKVSERRAQAIAQTASYYDKLYGNDPSLQGSRHSFAMKENTLPSAARRQDLTKFFFWTAWAASTERPGMAATYTNNWPHEPLIDNTPTAENVVWSIVSVVLLIAGVGLLVWAWAFLHKHDEDPVAPKSDPLASFGLTASQRALGKYLFLVVALLTTQVLLGGVTAHYTVEGQNFYGIPLSEWFPYSLVRTWHIQAALFWIATGFLAFGLFFVPILNGGKDPKFQRLGVNVLFVALVIVAVGSFVGNYLAIAQIMPPELSFWFGHQGYEYLDLGRFWQLALFAGLLIWLGLMLRGVIPAFKRPDNDKNLLALLSFSIVAVGLFYGSGLFYGERTHLSVMEYWRWWVVHLWVEGFFEVFATTALAFLFSTMGLVSKRGATMAALASASLFMLGGVPGTLHHLYFSGTTTPIMAIGATFSALEVVPLVVLGYEAWENWRLKERASWMASVRWPVICFVTVAFWNMLGAGVFGFMINPPISLYYIQGLNTTPVHAHAALFGVYGFLALGFVLLVLRYIRPNHTLDARAMRLGFWCLNGGLALMICSSLLPIGLFQFHASVAEGMWYARGEAFLQQDILQTLRWVRTLGDSIFIVGAVTWTWQVVRGVFKLGGATAARPAGVAVAAR